MGLGLCVSFCVIFRDCREPILEILRQYLCSCFSRGIRTAWRNWEGRSRYSNSGGGDGEDSSESEGAEIKHIVRLWIISLATLRVDFVGLDEVLILAGEFLEISIALYIQSFNILMIEILGSRCFQYCDNTGDARIFVEWSEASF